MSEKSEMTVIAELDRSVALVKAPWKRPEWRLIDAKDAEISNHANTDGVTAS